MDQEPVWRVMLTFDEAAHRYYVGGRHVPNVTSVLAPLTDYSQIPPDTLERAREEGIAVHKMAELHFKNDLESVPDWMKGHHQALLKFIDDTGFECWSTEHRVYHEKFDYAGTLDMAGILTKLPKVKDGALIDIKRSFYAGPVIGVQTAAYEDARNKEVPKDLRTRKRFALRLDANGTYRLQPFEDPGDFGVFLASLTMYRWRQQHGKH